MWYAINGNSPRLNTLSWTLASKNGNNAHIKSFATDPRKPPCQSIKIAWSPAHSRSVDRKLSFLSCLRVLYLQLSISNLYSKWFFEVKPITFDVNFNISKQKIVWLCIAVTKCNQFLEPRVFEHCYHTKDMLQTKNSILY